MGLADDLRQAQQKAPRGCKVSDVLQSLPKEDADALSAALALTKQDLQHTDLVEVLAKYGHVMAVSTLGRHRNGKCGCYGAG